MSATDANANGNGMEGNAVAISHISSERKAANLETSVEIKSQPEVRVVSRKRIWQVKRFQVLVVLHIIYVGAVAGFWGASEVYDGLWKVHDWNYIKETKGSFIDRSLWWTALPTFFFSALGLYMRRCYGDILELEPFLDAYRKPTAGRRSVLADYRRHLPPKAALDAFKNRHFLSSFALILIPFFTVVLVPLSSHLLETKLYRHMVDGNALQSTAINLGRLNEKADFSRAFDITSALEAYGGGGNVFSQWMDHDHAFPSFVAQNETWAYNTTVEIPEVAGHYGQLLNCTFLASGDYELTALGGGGNTTDATLRLKATKDGCDLEHELNVEGSDFDVYFSTGAVDCSKADDAGKNITSSRLLFLLAWPRPGEEEKLALATQLAVCSAVYGVDVGTLKISVLDKVSIQSFEPSECIGSGDSGCRGYLSPDGTKSEFRAMSKAIVEHSGSLGIANRKTSTFGNLILNRFDVSRRDQSAPLEELWPSFEGEFQTDMIDSIQAIYKTFFLTAISTMAFEAAGWPLDFKSTKVEVATDIEKLFAVPWVCALVLVVLLGSLVLASAGYFLSRRMRDWDVNVPTNVIETLELLCDNDELVGMARDVKHNGVQNSETKAFRKPFGQLAEERWTYKEAMFEVEAAGTARSLVVRGLDRR